MPIVLFEDEHVARLDPVALGKPAYTIHCGGTWLARLLRDFRPLEVRLRPHLHTPFAVDCEDKVDHTEEVLWLNARLVPSVDALSRVERMLRERKPAIVMSNGSIAAAMLPPRLTFGQAHAGAPPAAAFQQLGLPLLDVALPLFDYPHDIIRHHLAGMYRNLERHVERGHYEEVADGVFAAPGAKLGDFVVTDTGRGPIVLEEGATVGPHCYLAGPIWLGRSARILPHAAVKDCVSIGDYSKVGGEVDASIFESYSNKQHHGFLGHSYVGHWVNIGAGTSNSDLKNTYGPVNMEYRGQKVATGMQFLGIIIGDYAKTAINTSIFTGKTIGVCSMCYGFVTANVPSFVNYARSLGQISLAEIEPLAATQRRMFERRGRVQQAEDVQLLRDMFQLTEYERAPLGDELTVGPLVF